MLGLTRASLPSLLRLLVLGLMVAGLLVKPMLAMACDISDGRLTLAGDHQPVVNKADAGLTEDCCPSQDCGECCFSATTLLPAASVGVLHLQVIGPMATLTARFEPLAYPAGFRPPITG